MSTPIIPGFEWTFDFRLVPTPPETTPVALFPVGAQLRAEFREKPGSPVLATCTTQDGSLVRVADDQLRVVLPANASRTWTVKKVRFDVVRTDTTPDQYIPVRFTVTVDRSITVTTEPAP